MEEDKVFLNSKMYRAGGGIQTSVIVSLDFYKLCREHRIKFSEAMRVGISILLAERGVRDYDNNLNIVRRVNELKLKALEYAKKASELENGQSTSNTD